MIWQRLRLPRDNAPDDTETRAFQNYDTPTRFLLPHLNRYIMVGGVMIAAVLFAAGVYLMLPEAEPAFVVVPNENIIRPPATADPVLSIPDAVPAVVERAGITIPSRIDNTLSVQGARVYAFHAVAGVQWAIRVEAGAQFTPTVTLYGPDGSIVDSSIGSQNAEMLLDVADGGTYTLLIEDTFAVGGQYTLWILPT